MSATPQPNATPPEDFKDHRVCGGRGERPEARDASSSGGSVAEPPAAFLPDARDTLRTQHESDVRQLSQEHRYQRRPTDVWVNPGLPPGVTLPDHVVEQMEREFLAEYKPTPDPLTTRGYRRVELESVEEPNADIEALMQGDDDPDADYFTPTSHGRVGKRGPELGAAGAARHEFLSQGAWVEETADDLGEFAATCTACGEEFTAKRSDAKTCSNRCRQALHKRSRGRVTLSGIEGGTYGFDSQGLARRSLSTPSLRALRATHQLDKPSSTRRSEAPRSGARPRDLAEQLSTREAAVLLDIAGLPQPCEYRARFGRDRLSIGQGRVSEALNRLVLLGMLDRLPGRQVSAKLRKAAWFQVTDRGRAHAARLAAREDVLRTRDALLGELSLLRSLNGERYGPLADRLDALLAQLVYQH